MSAWGYILGIAQAGIFAFAAGNWQQAREIDKPMWAAVSALALGLLIVAGRDA